MVYTNKARVNTKKISADVRVKIDNYTNYCRIYYREQCKDVQWEQKKNICNTLKMGCPQCEELSYKLCWTQGHDMHTLN